MRIERRGKGTCISSNKRTLQYPYLERLIFNFSTISRLYIKPNPTSFTNHARKLPFLTLVSRRDFLSKQVGGSGRSEEKSRSVSTSGWLEEVLLSRRVGNGTCNLHVNLCPLSSLLNWEHGPTTSFPVWSFFKWEPRSYGWTILWWVRVSSLVFT